MRGFESLCPIVQCVVMVAVEVHALEVLVQVRPLRFCNFGNGVFIDCVL